MESIDRAGREINQGMEDVKRSGERAADEARDTGHRLRRDLKADLGRLLDELDEILRSEASADIQALRERVAAQLDNVRSVLASASDRATDVVCQAKDCTEAYVRERPWHALGLTAGVAFLLGLIVARR